MIGNTAIVGVMACVEMFAIGHVIVVARHPEKNADLKPICRTVYAIGTADRIVGMDHAIEGRPG